MNDTEERQQPEDLDYEQIRRRAFELWELAGRQGGTKSMRKLLLSGAAGLCLVSGAQAQVPPAYNWTGFYIGLNLGYGWGETSGSNTSLPGFTSIGPPIGAAVTIPDFVFSTDTETHGMIGGLQFGYNFKVGGLVFGIEADFQGADIHGRSQSGTSFSHTEVFDTGVLGVTITSTLEGTAASFVETNLDWFGTVRGRLGFTPGGSVLALRRGAWLMDA